MQLGQRALAAWLWVLFAVVVGVGLILLNISMIVSIVGVIAIILGLISLMPALMYTLEDETEEVV